jgi:hypothetical protein
MSTFPKITIAIANGQLGSVQRVADRVAALILSGEATDGIELGEPKQIFSPRALETLGITKENNPLAYKEVNAFYKEAGQGAELWLCLFAPATLLASECDEYGSVQYTQTIAKGRIRLFGINRITPANYDPVITSGMDADIVTAIEKLHGTLDSLASQFKPARALLPAIACQYNESLINLRESSYNRVGVVAVADAELFTETGQSGSPTNMQPVAAIGLALGRLAKNPPHRNIGRVKDGAVISEALFMTGFSPLEYEELWAWLHDMGYIFMRTYQGKNGYYFSDDPVCAPLSDDYNSFSLGRVIDKAIVIAYQTYVEELLDNVEIGPDGKLPASTCKYFEGRIDNAVNQLMTGEISGFNSFVNPEQNVLSTSKLAVTCSIVPLGTLKEIVVELGFENPALSQ